MLNNPPSRAHSANMNALTGTPRHVRPHHVAGLCERADERPDFALDTWSGCTWCGRRTKPR
jgi:hypothetical protein